ncbi:MAG: hypothetical protein AB7W59_02290 [Acidimicrobiia bacterium]
MAEVILQPIDGNGNNAGEPIIAPFAPSELAFSKSVQYAEVAIPGLNQPLSQFVRGDAETISIELFFDSTDTGMGEAADSVTDQVERVAKLVAVKGDLHRPPLVRLSWGEDFPAATWGAGAQAEPTFTAVVLSVARRYTLFSPAGKPLRAVVTVSLRQYATIDQQLKAMNQQSSDHTRVHIVSEGETLPLIAHDAYDDVTAWRLIADFNNLSDVANLEVGRQLALPPRARRA